MGKVTKTLCDHCGKEVVDVYLERGWIQLGGPLTRSWGTRRQGNAQSDHISKDTDFCSIECLVKELDKIRKKAGGPPHIPAPPHQPSEPHGPTSETAWDVIGKTED